MYFMLYYKTGYYHTANGGNCQPDTPSESDFFPLPADFFAFSAVRKAKRGILRPVSAPQKRRRQIPARPFCGFIPRQNA